MAVLDNDDFKFYKRALRRDPIAKAEMILADLSKAQGKAALQAIEDDFSSRRLTIKGLMDTAAVTIFTNTMARKLGKVWMEHKWENE